MDRLTIAGEQEPVVIAATHATLTIAASQHYIQTLTQLIYDGIDLWDESELTG